MDSEKKAMYYRVTDPLENLKIGINIREAARIKRDGEHVAPYSEQRVISWQEKLHGPSEVSRFLKLPAGANPKSVAERETARQLRLQESQGVNVSSLLKPVMLHTYVQKDTHIEHTPPSVADSRGLESYVGAAISRTSHFDASRGVVDPRSIRVENRVFRDKPYKVMYICLAHNVDVEAMSSKHGLWDDSFYYKHAVLCEMRLYSDGLLEMYPGFSERCKEGFVSAVGSNSGGGSTRGRTDSATEGSGGGQGQGPDSAVAAESVAPTAPAKLDTFMNNQTILSAFKQGFRLQTFMLRTPDGGLFEYSIENLNEAPLIESVTQHLSDLTVRPIKGVTPSAMTARAAASAANATAPASGGSGGGRGTAAADMSRWKQDGPSRGHDYTTTVYAEIISGSGFEGRKLYVSYQVLCPSASGGSTSHWTLRKGNLTDGVVAGDLVAQYRSNRNRSSVAGAGGGGGGSNTSSDAQLMAAVNNMEMDRESEGCLQGTTHLAVNSDIKGRYALGCGSANGGRGGSTVHGGCSHSGGSDKYPSHFGMLTLGGMDETTRMIAGLTFFLLCCLAVVLGIEYPFWLLPGLVVYFVLGDGMPGGGDILVMNGVGTTLATSVGASCGGSGSKDHQRSTVHQHAHHGLAGRVLQVAANSGVTDPVAQFNHLINLSFDVNDSTLHGGGPSASAGGAKGSGSGSGAGKDYTSNSTVMGGAATAPTILFEVHSVGWFGRVSLEGYGYTHIPLYGSTGEVEIKTWRPLGTLGSRLYNFYCGGGSQLHNKRFTGIPNPSQRSINRFGMVTESSGVIKFKANVITSDPRRIVRVDHEEANRRAQTQKVRKTVDDILHNFKATGTVSSATVTSTLLRASTQSNLFASMNAGGGGPGGSSNALLSASAALNRSALSRTHTHGSLPMSPSPQKQGVGGGGGIAGGLKAVVTDHSSVNSRVADIIARAKAAKAASTTGGTTPSPGPEANVSASATAASASASSPATASPGAGSGAKTAASATVSTPSLASAPAPRSRISGGIVEDDEDDDEDEKAVPVKVIPPRGSAGVAASGGGGSNRTPGGGESTGLAPIRGGRTPGGVAATGVAVSTPPPRTRPGRYNNALRDSVGSDAGSDSGGGLR